MCLPDSPVYQITVHCYQFRSLYAYYYILGVTDGRGQYQSLDLYTMEDGGGGGTKPQFDRVFFIVDRTRLKDERDELKNAIVVYIPERDLSKV